MIWLALASIAIGILIYAFLCAAGDADDRDERLIAEIQAMRSECPWPMNAPFHSPANSSEAQHERS